MALVIVHSHKRPNSRPTPSMHQNQKLPRASGGYYSTAVDARGTVRVKLRSD
jgi:hypothetical protein